MVGVGAVVMVALEKKLNSGALVVVGEEKVKVAVVSEDVVDDVVGVVGGAGAVSSSSSVELKKREVVPW